MKETMKETMKDIKWTTIIPLIGGAAVGCEYAVGKPPEFVASYTGFWNNDQHYMNYLNNIRGLDVPYINLTENQEYSNKVDIATCVPPLMLAA